jgi:hypothetical protein
MTWLNETSNYAKWPRKQRLKLLSWLNATSTFWELTQCIMCWRCSPWGTHAWWVDALVVCTQISSGFLLSHTPCFPSKRELRSYDKFSLIHFTVVLLCIRVFLLGVSSIIWLRFAMIFSNGYRSPNPVTLWDPSSFSYGKKLQSEVKPSARIVFKFRVCVEDVTPTFLVWWITM